MPLSPLSLTHRQFETVIPTEDSVITEMTSTLRDWGAMWKRLYVVKSVQHTHVGMHAGIRTDLHELTHTHMHANTHAHTHVCACTHLLQRGE